MNEDASYTEWRYERVCARKVPYESLADAARGIIKVQRRWGEKTVPYECPFCGNWHLTTKKTTEL